MIDRLTPPPQPTQTHTPNKTQHLARVPANRAGLLRELSAVAAALGESVLTDLAALRKALLAGPGGVPAAMLTRPAESSEVGS